MRMTNANDSCLFFINYWIYWRKRTTKTLQIEMHEISCEINVHCCILWVSSKILKIKNLKLIKLDVFVLIYRCFFLHFFWKWEGFYSTPCANIITSPGSTITSSLMCGLSQLNTNTACLPGFKQSNIHKIIIR